MTDNEIVGEPNLSFQHTHDEVIAWIDKEVKFIDEIHPNGGNSKNVTSFWTNYRASLIANRAGLERHKPKEHCKNPNCTGPVCSECGSKETVQIGFPCPTYTEIYNPIVSVM